MITLVMGSGGLDDRAIVSPGLRLCFSWAGDRWSHALEVGPPALRLRSAVSQEGDAAAEAPDRVISPAYQQIHFQEDPLGAVALLVGQSGPHHFSACFRVTAGPGRVAVDVDVADRMRGGDALLACSYRVDLPPSTLVDAEPARVIWQPCVTGPGRLILTSRGLPDQPTDLALAEAGRRAVRLQAVAATVAGAPHQRCRYRWSWFSPSAGGG